MDAEIKIVIRILPLHSRNYSIVTEDSCKHSVTYAEWCGIKPWAQAGGAVGTQTEGT